jgi:tetratricopeptide (TPR) repeat protein
MPSRVSAVAPPAAVDALLQRAIAADSGNPALWLKLANLNLDRYDYVAAAAAFETTLRLDPTQSQARRLLAHCYNALGRHSETIEVLAGADAPDFERARAFLVLGRDGEAEAEFGWILEADPHDRQACRLLCRMLRRAHRVDDLLETCETLAARGACHAQLLYVWGTALVLAGQHERAAAILLDRERIAELELPLPDGFADHAAFNTALAEELLDNPYRLSAFPTDDEANRGSSRVHALFAGKRPELIHGLLESLQHLAEAWLPPRHVSTRSGISIRAVG